MAMTGVEGWEARDLQLSRSWCVGGLTTQELEVVGGCGYGGSGTDSDAAAVAAYSLLVRISWFVG